MQCPARLSLYAFTAGQVAGSLPTHEERVLFPILVTHAVYRPRILVVGSFTLALSLRGWYLIEVTR